MKAYPYFLALLLLSNAALAQDDKIDPERPSKTQNASAVGKKTFQLEAGYKFEDVDESNHHYSQPEMLLRFGLMKNVELRAEMEISRYTTKAGSSHSAASGLEPVIFGFKTSLLKGNGALPKTAFIADVSVPGFSSEKFKTPHAAPRFRLAFENDLTKKIKLGYNVAAEWDGTATTPGWVYTLSPEFELSDRCQFFVEAFGRVTNNEAPESSVDAGIMFFINDNFTLDLSSGAGLSKQADKYFVSVGGAIRF